MFGTNPVEPFLRHHDGQELDIKEIFPTLQGEGPFAGRAATFVRLGGCHLACYFCDTDFTTDRVKWQLDDLAQKIRSYRNRLVVLTGGEPLRQNVVPLCDKLIVDAIVQIETAGSFWPWGEAAERLSVLCAHGKVQIVVSPKAGKVHPLIDHHAIAWKYIITRDDPLGDDGLPIRSTQQKDSTQVRVLARPPPGTDPEEIYLQPCDDGRNDDALMKRCAELCMKHGYRLSLQQHKLLGLP